MRLFRLLTLYMAVALGANAAVAADSAAIEALKDGDMKKLTIHADPVPVPDIEFFLGQSSEPVTLEKYRGKYVLLNFWATWCAPCRKEMPTLSELQAEFGGDQFQVVTIATGRNSPSGVDKFFKENGISNLPQYLDPKQALARQMGVLGLPITVLIDPDGNELARLIGDAEWNSESAKKIVASLLSGM